jgi:hypothetical protein
MNNVAIANLEAKFVTLWVDDTRIPIGPNAQVSLAKEVAERALLWAQRNGYKVVPAEQTRQVAEATAQAVANVLALGPVIPLKRFDEKNLMALDKAILVQIAADCGSQQTYSADTPKKAIVADLLQIATPLAAAPETPAPTVPPSTPTPSEIGDTQPEAAAQPQ